MLTKGLNYLPDTITNDKLQFRNLSVLSYAQGHTLWALHIEQELLTNGLPPVTYFQPAYDMFASGDVIHIIGLDATAIRVVQKINGSILLQKAL